jgi:STE24 endopeptidase
LANEDKATRYQRLHRQAAVASAALTAAFLAVVLASGASAALRDFATRAAAPSFAGALLIYTIVLAAGHELLQLPLAFYRGLTLERRYGLSTQAAGAWWRDHLKGSLLGLVFGAAGALLIWSLLRWSATFWWAAAAAAFALVLVLLAHLAPILLLPIFYDFKPLEREDLARRLIGLAERAGTHVAGVFEWRLSDRTRKANAAFTGLGRTRRILLSDTLLGEYSDDEVEVILAHELAHQVHRDIWSAIALETGLIAVGFFLVDRVLSAAGGAFGLTGKADLAAMPLLLLTLGAVTIAFVPVANAFSRAHERRADRYALEMTSDVPAFVSAMRRLAAQNLAEERPSRLVELMFYTHPPTIARIDAARAWERNRLTT